MGTPWCWRSARRGVAAKPDSCKGCPLYGDGRGFVPDELREGAAVLIVGQGPGAEECEQGRPFVGATGKSMEKYLRDAGLTRDEVSVGNAIRCRWRNTNDLPPLNQVISKDALRHCWQAHGRIPNGTRLIVAQGDYASTTLVGSTISDGDKSTGWRGYLRPYVWHDTSYPSIIEPWVPCGDHLPVLLTVHLARLFREPWYTLPTRLDWAKIPRILSGKWPRKPPKFNLEAPREWPEVFAFDTEWYKVKLDDQGLQRLRKSHDSRDQMSAMLGALEPGEASAMSSHAETAHWDEVFSMLRTSSGRTNHSALSEDSWKRARRLLQGFERTRRQMRHLQGIATGQEISGSSTYDRSLSRVEQVSGTSLSAVQYWLGALWKLEETSERRYQVPRLVRYSASWGTGDYETCVVEKRNHRPPKMTGRPRVITQYAPADVNHLADLTGTRWQNSVWDSYLIEDTVWKHAVLWSDHPHDLNYLGSLYSSFNRWKHLSDRNPILYSGLDAVGLLEVDQALERELGADPQSRLVWEGIDRPALGEFVRAQYHGLRTHSTRVNEVVTMLKDQADEATHRAQAIAGWRINLGSNPQVGHRLYEVEGIRPGR